MVRRFLLGLVEGLVVGIGLAFCAVRGLGLGAPNTLISALLAGAAGLLVGLIAGRPVWAHGAKTEAALKAFAGSLVGVGLSFALGRFLTAPVDLSPLSLGAGPAGKLLALNLPAIACALALFFELDDTGPSATKTRLPAPTHKQRLTSSDDVSSDRAEFDAPREARVRTDEKR